MMVRPREHTREEFVDAAIRIVDAEGLEALTLRRLGSEVGVSFTALYTYFSTREDLIAAGEVPVHRGGVDAEVLAEGPHGEGRQPVGIRELKCGL